MRPDLALELNLVAASGAGRRVDLFLEQDRTRRASANVGKLEKYDAFLTAWALALDRCSSGSVRFVRNAKYRQFGNSSACGPTSRTRRTTRRWRPTSVSAISASPPSG
ncbi:MAG: hypothetical protein M3P39_05990 [Actinomycetota bacterium]|nr:hypothetical protein [Actinomycetota bacterium]